MHASIRAVGSYTLTIHHTPIHTTGSRTEARLRTLWWSGTGRLARCPSPTYGTRPWIRQARQAHTQRSARDMQVRSSFMQNTIVKRPHMGTFVIHIRTCLMDCTRVPCITPFCCLYSMPVLYVVSFLKHPSTTSFHRNLTTISRAIFNTLYARPSSCSQVGVPRDRELWHSQSQGQRRGVHSVGSYHGYHGHAGMGQMRIYWTVEV